MIATMDQVLVVGRKSSAKELLATLQQLGVMHLVPAHGEQLGQFTLSEKDTKVRAAWNEVVSRSEALLLNLGVAKPTSPVAINKERVPNSLHEVQNYLADTSLQADRLVAERAEIDDELEVIDLYLPQYRKLGPMLALLEESHYLTGVGFAVPSNEVLLKVQSALDEALPERYDLAVVRDDKAFVAVAAVLNDDIDELAATLSRLGISELTLPERYREEGVAKAVHTMEERVQTLPKRRKNVQAEIDKLALAQQDKLFAIHETAQNYQARYNAFDEMAGGRYSFAVQGWVPSAERARVIGALEKQFGHDVVVETRRADDHHDDHIPVRLDNPGWVKPFEGLLSLFAPPQYGYFDPSWTLAVFFPLFFGIVVGDMGFGLLFLLLGVWLRARGKAGKQLSLGPLGITLQPAALPSIGTVINWCAMWAIVWGFLYGEFFGNFLEHWPHNNPVFYVPGHHGHGMIPIALFRVEQYMPLLFVALGFGVFQVLFGWAIRAYFGWQHKDMKHFWEGIGMFSGLSAVVLFAYGYLTHNLNGFITFLVIAGFLLFLAGVFLSRVFLMIVELISNSGHILSYLRLFAVGLSAALVANLATNLGFYLAEHGVPVIGPILGIVVALAVHLLAIALTIIGHTLQPLRLQYVEFFTKFGFYDHEGTPYRPFRYLGGKA